MFKDLIVGVHFRIGIYELETWILWRNGCLIILCLDYNVDGEEGDDNFKDCFFFENMTRKLINNHHLFS